MKMTRVRHFLVLILVNGALLTPSLAQDHPWDISAGYSGIATHGGANGIQIAIAEQLKSHIGGEFEWNYYSNSSSGFFSLPSGNEYLYMGGPKFTFHPIFLHALFGGITANDSHSQTGFAMALGGGVDVRITSHLSVRPSIDYLLTHINITQNNARAGVGLTYTFGGRTAQEQANANRKPTATVTRLGVAVAQHTAPDGLEIVDVTPKSLADLSSLRVGDLITSIDGAPQLLLLSSLRVSPG